MAEEGARSTSRRRTIGWALVVVWFVVLALGAALAVSVAWQGDTACEPEGDSPANGQLVWSAVPPGPSCVYDVETNGIDRTDGPSSLVSAWFATLIVVLIAAAWALRRDGPLADDPDFDTEPGSMPEPPSGEA